jgi:hypothetical protein
LASAGLLHENRTASRSRGRTPVPVRIRIAVPPEGFGNRLGQVIGWLDANCGADTRAPAIAAAVVPGFG